MKKIKNIKQLHCASSFSKSKGFTLIEVIIAISISGLVLSSLLILQNIFFKVNNLYNQSFTQLETNLNAMVLLKHYIRLTGYTTNPQKKATYKASIYPMYLFGCSKDIQNHETVLCSQSNRFSDTAAFGYDANDLSTWKLSSGQYADCRGYGLAEKSDIAIFNLRQNSADSISQFYCSSGSGRLAQALFDNIDSFQIRYLLNNSNSLQPAHLLSMQDWENVIAVEFCLHTKKQKDIGLNQICEIDENNLSQAQRKQLIKTQIVLRNFLLNQ